MTGGIVHRPTPQADNQSHFFCTLPVQVVLIDIGSSE